MNPVHIIARKRDGRELTRDEISFFVSGFDAGRIPNYQMSALTMAICLKGMTTAETAALTEELLASGSRLTWARSPVQDSVPRLEKATTTQRSHATVPASAAVDDDDSFSLLDARDTVEFGDDDVPSTSTLMLDGSEKEMLLLPPQVASSRDTVDLDALLNSTVEMPVAYKAIVDKYSTGGIGDKTSLILAPLLACCGLRVPMISGRGVGLGGTLDKLESIPGFRAELSLDEIQRITQRVGCVIAGASADLAPADRKLYSLREVTSTVASIPLITASVLSKKLAEGLDALVMDVKWGSGASMKSLASARKLAELLVATARQCNIKAAALVTNMDQPLGRMVGATLEVDEALEVLAGKGPRDVWTITRDLAVELLLASSIAPDVSSAQQMLKEHVTSGRAIHKFREMISAQGGDLNAPRVRCSFQFDSRATRSGYVGRMNAETLGLAMIEMGGGRRILSDSFDHSVGLEMLVKIGDRVDVGQPLVRVHCRENQADSVRALVRAAIPVRAQALEPAPLITERIG